MIVSCWRLRWRHNTGRNINNRFCISISANCRWGCSMVTKSMSGSNSCYSCTPRWFLRAFSSARWIWWDTQPIWRSQTSWRWWTDLKRKRNIWKLINMNCGLNMTSPHPTKITKWPHILVIPLVGSPKPRTKRKNSPTHPGTEKREAKVVILGDFRGGLRVLFHRFQTWACGYEEI